MTLYYFFFFFQAEDGIRDYKVTGVQTCALPISVSGPTSATSASSGPSPDTVAAPPSSAAASCASSAAAVSASGVAASGAAVSSSADARGFEKSSVVVIGSVVEEEDALGEDVVGAEDQRSHEHHRDQHDDRGVHDLRAGRPGDLAQLAPDLGEELGGAGALGGLRGRGRAPLGTLRLVAALLLGHPPHLSVLLVHRFGLPGTGPGLVMSRFCVFGAGQEGLEPPTAGFGDRSSAKLSYCPPGARGPGRGS